MGAWDFLSDTFPSSTESMMSRFSNALSEDINEELGQRYRDEERGWNSIRQFALASKLWGPYDSRTLRLAQQIPSDFDPQLTRKYYDAARERAQKFLTVQDLAKEEPYTGGVSMRSLPGGRGTVFFRKRPSRWENFPFYSDAVPRNELVMEALAGYGLFPRNPYPVPERGGRAQIAREPESSQPIDPAAKDAILGKLRGAGATKIDAEEILDLLQKGESHKVPNYFLRALQAQSAPPASWNIDIEASIGQDLDDVLKKLGFSPLGRQLFRQRWAKAGFSPDVFTPEEKEKIAQMKSAGATGIDLSDLSNLMKRFGHTVETVPQTFDINRGEYRPLPPAVVYDPTTKKYYPQGVRFPGEEPVATKEPMGRWSPDPNFFMRFFDELTKNRRQKEQQPGTMDWVRALIMRLLR